MSVTANPLFSLSALAAQLEALRSLLIHHPTTDRDTVDEILTLARDGPGDSRQAIHALRTDQAVLPIPPTPTNVNKRQSAFFSSCFVSLSSASLPTNRVGRSTCSRFDDTEKNPLASNCFHHGSTVTELEQLMERTMVINVEYK